MQTNIDNKTIDQIITLFNYKDKNKVTYFYTIEGFFNAHDDNGTELISYKDGNTGVEKLQHIIDDAKEMDMIFLHIKEYSSTSAQKGSAKNIYKVSLSDMAKLPDPSIQQHPLNESFSESFQNPLMQEMGGLAGFLQKHQEVGNLSLELKMIRFELDKEKEENTRLRIKNEELDKECDQLAEQMEEYKELAEEYEQYVPGKGKTLFGMDPGKLGGSILSNAITKIAINNPGATKKFLGLGDSEFQEIVRNFNGEDPRQVPQQSQTQATAVSFEEVDESANLTEDQRKMLEVIKGISEYLKSLTAEQLGKVYKVISFFGKEPDDFENIEILLQAINNQQQ